MNATNTVGRVGATVTGYALIVFVVSAALSLLLTLFGSYEIPYTLKSGETVTIANETPAQRNFIAAALVVVIVVLGIWAKYEFWVARSDSGLAKVVRRVSGADTIFDTARWIVAD